MTPKTKKQNIAAAAFSLICALLLVAVLFLIWVIRVRPAEDKALSVRISDDYTNFTDVIESCAEIRFSHDDDLYAAAVVFNTVGEQPSGELEVILVDSSENIVSRSTGIMDHILPGQYTGLGLDTPVRSDENASYVLKLIPHYTNSGRLTLGCCSDGTKNISSVTIDGHNTNADAALLLTVKQIGRFVSRFYWTVFLLGGLILLVLLLGAYLCSAKLYQVYAVVALTLGLLFCFLLPPYSAPDEQFHINQSFSIATTFTSDLPLSSVPLCDTYRRPSDHNTLLENKNTTVFTWQEYINTLPRFSSDSAGSYKLFQEMQVDDSDYLYYPSALTVAICFLLRAGFSVTLLCGRLANLLLYILLTTLSVRFAPFGKRIFAAVGLLPMSLHLAASFSRDGITIGLAMLFTSLCLYAAYGDKEKVSGKTVAVLFILGVLLVPAKIVYFPLAGLFFLIPSVRFVQNPVKIRVFFAVICAAALMLSGARYTIAGLFTRADSEQSLAVQTAELDYEEAEVWNLGEESNPADLICYSPSYILKHPAQTGILCFNSIVENGEHYIKTLVGGKLSYYSLNISWVWVLLLYILLLASIIPCRNEDIPDTYARIFIGVIACFCMALAVAGCVSWTPTYYTSIYGLQGRYFLPALPAFMIALRSQNICIAKPSPLFLVCFTFVNYGCLLNVFLSVIAR